MASIEDGQPAGQCLRHILAQVDGIGVGQGLKERDAVVDLVFCQIDRLSPFGEYDQVCLKKTL